MSVLIKGMEMPTNCHECPLLFVTSICDGSKDCPLVHVPPHGRLIDADALISVLAILQDKGSDPVVWEQMRYIAEDMPTIIPAESEGNT